MNNSISLEPEQEPRDMERFEEKQGVLERELVALRTLEKTPEWRTLKELVFDGRVENLEKQLVAKSLEKEVNLPDLYRLQGRLSEAKRTANLEKTVSVEHRGIKNTLLAPGTASEPGLG